MSTFPPTQPQGVWGIQPGDVFLGLWRDPSADPPLGDKTRMLLAVWRGNVVFATAGNVVTEHARYDAWAELPRLDKVGGIVPITLSELESNLEEGAVTLIQAALPREEWHERIE